MNVVALETSLQGLDSLTGIDSLCLFVAADDRPLQGLSGFVDWRLRGQLSRILIEGDFLGDNEDWLLIPTVPQMNIPRIFAMGIGNLEDLSDRRVDECLAVAARKLSRAKMISVALEIPQSRFTGTAALERLNACFIPEFSGERVVLFRG